MTSWQNDDLPDRCTLPDWYTPPQKPNHEKATEFMIGFVLMAVGLTWVIWMLWGTP